MGNLNTSLNKPNGAAEAAKESVADNSNKVTAPIEDTELEQEYIDERFVTISPVHNYSNYRRVNMKVLGHKKETIGSSIRSTQILSSNAEEVNTYFIDGQKYDQVFKTSAGNIYALRNLTMYLSGASVLNGKTAINGNTYIFGKLQVGEYNNLKNWRKF